MNAPLRPSALPILAKSPLFTPGAGTEWTDAGTLRHKALASYYNDPDGEALEDFDDEAADAIRWAADQIRILAPVNDFPVRFEVPVTIPAPDLGDDIPGTADVVCGPVLLDLKSRPRSYDEQMAAYALGLLCQNPDLQLIRAHLLFATTRTVSTLEFDLDGALDLVWRTIRHAQEATVCKISEYCSWCAIRHRCDLYTAKAFAIADGRDDWPAPKNFHASELDDPAELGKALRLARLVARWAEAVEHHALDAATKRGLVAAGFELKAVKARQWIKDTAGAFPLLGLPQTDFLKCCDLRLNTSPTYPDKLGAVDLYREKNGMKKAPAKREVLEKLAPVLATGNPGLKLAPIKEGTETEETTQEHANI